VVELAVASLAMDLAISWTPTYTAPWRRSDLSGIAAILAATAFFVVGDSFMKLITEDLPPFEALFLRRIVASLFCAVIVAVRGEWRAIAGALNRHALLRVLGESLCTLCYIVALARMPIADVIAILQTGPLILILAAAVLLRERVGPTRLTLTLAGFAGALMVAQLSASGISAAGMWVPAPIITSVPRQELGYVCSGNWPAAHAPKDDAAFVLDAEFVSP